MLDVNPITLHLTQRFPQGLLIKEGGRAGRSWAPRLYLHLLRMSQISSTAALWLCLDPQAEASPLNQQS